MSIGDSEHTGLIQAREELLIWGWNFCLESTALDSTIAKFNNMSVYVTTAPTVLGELVLASNLLKHLREIQTAGSSGSIPSFIVSILKSKACRGAVMFGDALTLLTQEKLVEALSSCANPHACAHGRTSVAKLGTYEM